MKKIIIVSVVLTALLAGAICAQQGQMSGQSSPFREEHKYTFQLMQMVRHIGEIDKDAKYALTPAQAKQVLAVLKPLRTKPKLTQDQAKQALKSLKPIFTVDQLNAMARIKEPQRRFGGSAGQGGPGGGQGNRPHFDMAARKDFNPFYAKSDKSDTFAAQHAKRFSDFFSSLEKKASTKSPAKPAARPVGKRRK